MPLVTTLIDILFPPRDTEILLRNRDEIDVFSSPVSIVGESGTVVALCSYRNPLVHALIIEAKYHKNKKAWRVLGALLTDYLLEERADANAFEEKRCVFVPVPLGEKRMHERGYNQVEEVLNTVEPSLKDFHIEVAHCLVRTRETKAQTELSGKARKENMEDAFRTVSAIDSSAKYIVVDDVFTTGATLHSAMGALRHAGATDVSGIALAH